MFTSKKDRLKLPSDYLIDTECYELLKYQLCLSLFEKNKLLEYSDKGFTIYLSYPIKIIYKGKQYWTAIVKNKLGSFNWYLRPYIKNNYYTCLIDKIDMTSFDIVIQAIANNDISAKK